MKKYILTILCAMTALFTQAQSDVKVQSVHLKNGTVVSFERSSVDSSRVVFTPEGDSLGVKIYVTGKESQDFLYSQLEFVVFYGNDTSADNNVNRNTAEDLQKNKEGWRLEFPRFYQGSDVTFEISHTTSEYGITYSLEWDGTKRANRWVCYEFSAATPDNNVGRNENFTADPDIPTQYQTTRSDFSGFSRGHLCASNDRQSSVEQNKQTFYYSNMQPQYQAHNGGQWSRLETAVQTWGNNRSFCDTLYVVKAATIDNSSQILSYQDASNYQVPVPKYFYMCLLAVKDGQYKAIGFWTEHVNQSESYDYSHYAKSIKEIEELTGIDFFCNLPDDIEQEVEESYNLSDWQ
ncbi:MAG: DNA/RNA non-specific endonuclease [Prevotella sp.]|jgi:endonuclease G